MEKPLHFGSGFSFWLTDPVSRRRPVEATNLVTLREPRCS